MFYLLFLILSITILCFFIGNSFNTIFSKGDIKYTVPEKYKIEPLGNNSTIDNIEQENSRDENQDYKNVPFRRINNRLVVNEKLKRFNHQLTRALRTLEYISIMETNSKYKRTSMQTKELSDLKENIQRQVLRLSKQIKEYKLHQNNSKAA